MLISSTQQGHWCSVFYAHIRKVLQPHCGEKVKVLIISCYFPILAVFLITTFTLHKIFDLEQTITDIISYFICEATGTLRECDKPSLLLHRRSICMVTHILSGLFPIVNLVYVLNVQELKRKISKCCPRSKQHLLRRRTGISMGKTSLTEQLLN